MSYSFCWTKLFRFIAEEATASFYKKQTKTKKTKKTTTTKIHSLDLGNMHHYNCKFSKTGIGASMNSIFMPSG